MKPYDAAGKELLETDPAGWAAFLGAARPPGRVRLLESELSAVTAAADKVLRVDDDPPWLLDVEFQSGRNPGAPRQLLKYNALLHDRHALPVVSVLVVLAESADAAAYTGRYVVTPPLGPAWEFGYTVVRVWRLPADALLAGPIGLLPLAPVAAVARDRVPDVVREVHERLSGETDEATTSRLSVAVGLLLQLRYGPVQTEEILRTYPDIREYAAFRMFIEDGRKEGRAETLLATTLRLGRKKFGPPTPTEEAALAAVADADRLETLTDKLLDVATWAELLKPD